MGRVLPQRVISLAVDPPEKLDFPESPQIKAQHALFEISNEPEEFHLFSTRYSREPLSTSANRFRDEDAKSHRARATYSALSNSASSRYNRKYSTLRESKAEVQRPTRSKSSRNASNFLSSSLPNNSLEPSPFNFTQYVVLGPQDPEVSLIPISNYNKNKAQLIHQIASALATNQKLKMPSPHKKSRSESSTSVRITPAVASFKCRKKTQESKALLFRTRLQPSAINLPAKSITLNTKTGKAEEADQKLRFHNLREILNKRNRIHASSTHPLSKTMVHPSHKKTSSQISVNRI